MLFTARNSTGRGDIPLRSGPGKCSRKFRRISLSTSFLSFFFVPFFLPFIWSLFVLSQSSVCWLVACLTCISGTYFCVPTFHNHIDFWSLLIGRNSTASGDPFDRSNSGKSVLVSTMRSCLIVARCFNCLILQLARFHCC
jgi:hypothetical protein